jgi:hypothetical protein
MCDALAVLCRSKATILAIMGMTTDDSSNLKPTRPPNLAQFTFCLKLSKCSSSFSKIMRDAGNPKADTPLNLKRAA